MKISTDTIKTLQNFASINNNIRIEAGNKLSTISPGKKVFARATIPDEFPQEFCVYDLNSLLSLLTLGDNPDIEFNDNSLVIRQGNSKTEFFYADEKVIIAPEKGKNIAVDEHYKFNLSASDVQTMIKAAGALAAKSVSIVSKAGKTSILVSDPKNVTSGSYRISLPASEHDFNVNFEIEDLKVLPEDYEVTLSKKKFLHFKHASRPLEYFIVLHMTSVV